MSLVWYLRYGLSCRDLEELLAERGIEVDHVTLCRWVQRFTPLIVDAARPRRHAVRDRWFVDETYVKVAGTWRYVYRAVDQHGQVIDAWVSKKRDVKAATRFFSRVIRGHAFIQNLRRGHYELGTESLPGLIAPAAFEELAAAL